MTQNLKTEAEETLRLVAQLPPPGDLAERVHQRLKGAQNLSPRRGFWSLWLPAHRLQYAGAALLVLAIAGSAWTVRHTGGGGAAKGQGPVQPAAQAVPQGFGTAGSEARPSSLKPIKVPPAPKKKPSASKVLKKRAPQAGATTQVGDSKVSASQ